MFPFGQMPSGQEIGRPYTFVKLIYYINGIHFMNLAGIDLNLLLVFDAVMAERNVTRAASRIGLSQPAMSNALNRLRYHLKDELFVRGADGMMPTPRALELAEPIRGSLANLEDALDPAGFDPMTSDHVFNIGTNDYVICTLIPRLASYLSEHAPELRIRLYPTVGKVVEMLDAREIDLGISSFGEMPDRFDSLTLIEDTYQVVMRKDHPLADRKLDLQRYAAADHLLVSPRGDAVGFVDTELAKRGLARNVRMTVNNFSSAPPILAASKMILTLPKRVADIHAPLHALHVTRCPVPSTLEYSSATVVWHRKLGSHPAHVWFREALAEIAKNL
jgi:DNA-binding transcriptional LysR family regulator